MVSIGFPADAHPRLRRHFHIPALHYCRHQKIEAILQQLGYSEDSPIPARFCQWMTDLMAAGYVLSYFNWLSLLFLT